MTTEPAPEERSRSTPADWLDAAEEFPLAFAQVREDAELDLQVLLSAPPNARMLMVASGGCTTALLAATGRLRHLHLVDPNPAQLALTRIKLRLLVDSDRRERLRLLGHLGNLSADSTARVRAMLSEAELCPGVFGPGEAIKSGLDRAGRYEKVFDQGLDLGAYVFDRLYRDFHRRVC